MTIDTHFTSAIPQSKTLAGKSALVTGGTTGVGHAIANRLACEGASVLITDLLDDVVGQNIARDISQKTGSNVAYARANLGAVAEIEALFDLVNSGMASCDILVNNAVVRYSKPTISLSTVEWNNAIAVNLSAPFHCIRLALPGMMKRKWGRIINLASIYSVRGTRHRVEYVTTKTAILGLTRAIAVEAAACGITCNAVSPGVVETDPIRQKINALANEHNATVDQTTRDYLTARHPTGRFIEATDIASLVAFLCGDTAKDITGACLPIDGGWQAS